MGLAERKTVEAVAHLKPALWEVTVVVRKEWHATVLRFWTVEGEEQSRDLEEEGGRFVGR